MTLKLYILFDFKDSLDLRSRCIEVDMKGRVRSYRKKVNFSNKVVNYDLVFEITLFGVKF